MPARSAAAPAPAAAGDRIVRRPLDPASLRVRIHDLFCNRWLLLCAGDFTLGRYNAMTVSWGSLGTMWNKPFAQVVVRPQRHTRGYLEEFGTFTLCAFRPALRPALELLGSQSGRDGNKIAASGLTPVAASAVGAPVFAEADLAIECRKIYWQDMDPRGFAAPWVAANYPAGDFHRVYFGEIVAVQGTEAYG
jgi:flavin reductase (DIM6/NTAB) family NADH-FMN oxidoreductase RutF